MGIQHRLAAAYLPRLLEARAYRRATHPRVTVLMYHEVLPDELDIPSWLVVREARFRRQMRYLKRHFRVLSLDAALDYMATAASQVKARRPPAVITFDDGYAGNFSCALPILQELRLPFTVYVSTAMLAEGGRFWHDRIIAALITAGRGRLSIETSAGTLEYSGSARLDARRWAGIERILTRLKDLAPAEREAIADRLDPDVKIPALRMMTPAELHELSASPLVTIGNHTHAHELLDQLDNDSAAATILQAQTLLEEWTGRRPVHFAYPNGNYVGETAALVERLGMSTAVTGRSRPWLETDALFEIPRIGIGRFDNLNLFRARMCGLLQ
ncbi:MAG: polysaccharide deacetylase family protein [Gammaproteobacteria bacterium]